MQISCFSCLHPLNLPSITVPVTINNCASDSYYRSICPMAILFFSHCFTFINQDLLLRLVPCTHSFIQSVIYFQQHGFSYSLGYNTMLYFIPASAIRCSYRLAPMSFRHVPFFSEHFFVFWHKRYSRNIMNFSYTSYGINQFFEEPQFLLLKNCRVQDLGIRYDCHSWSVTALRPSQRTE